MQSRRHFQLPGFRNDIKVLQVSGDGRETRPRNFVRQLSKLLKLRIPIVSHFETADALNRAVTTCG